jgi:L-threonylcarbamoyladenylate synthase
MKTINVAEVPEKEIIKTVIKVLNNSGLIIFPTETTYGAGVDATNQEAVDKLLAYKSRREGKPLSIAVANQKTAAKYVEINEQAKKIYERFLPGPITIISKNLGKVALGVKSEFNTLGVRIPNHELILEILKEFGKPITATSANASGKKRPYQIQDIFNNLSNKQQNLID